MKEKKEVIKMAMIQIEHLTFGYEGRQEKIFDDVSFVLDTEWKLGIIGRNGKGKTTLLKLLKGSLEYQGKIFTPVSFEYFPFHIQDPDQMVITLFEEIMPDGELWRLQKEMQMLNLKVESLYQPFSSLSGGEQIKFLLAMMFSKENTFFLIDEPTNHIDEETKQVLVKYFARKKGFLIVSHDREFLDQIIDHVCVLQNTKIEIQKGNFSSWEENQEKEEIFEEKQYEKKKKEIGELKEAIKQSSHWADQIEGSKYHTKNSGLRPDRGYIGHQSAKMMKKVKSIEKRQEKAIIEKESLLQNIDRKEDLKMRYLPYERKELLWIKSLKSPYGEKNDFQFSLEVGERIALVR